MNITPAKNLHRAPPAQSRRRRGLTLVEAMIMMVILSIIAVGVGVGLQSVTHVPDGTDIKLATHMRLMERMEQLNTSSFAALNAAIGNATLNDTVTINGQSVARTVTVQTCDADGDGVADNDFLQITVTVNGLSLITRRAQP